MKRELKGRVSSAAWFDLGQIARAIPMKRELKGTIGLRLIVFHKNRKGYPDEKGTERSNSDRRNTFMQPYRKGYPDEKGTERSNSDRRNTFMQPYRKGYPDEKGTEIYTEDGEYEKAIEVCEKAIAFGLSD